MMEGLGFRRSDFVEEDSSRRRRALRPAAISYRRDLHEGVGRFVGAVAGGDRAARHIFVEGA